MSCLMLHLFRDCNAILIRSLLLLLLTVHCLVIFRTPAVFIGRIRYPFHLHQNILIENA